MKDGKTHMAVLGYVFSIPKETINFKAHIGKDITGRLLTMLRNQSTDAEIGEPPYPDEAKMSEYERDYCWNALDHYFNFHCESDPSCVVGYIAEWDQKIASE